MKVIACLGNPGQRYIHTRHNAGMIVGSAIAQHYGIHVKKKEFDAITGTGEIENIPCIFVFPQTYMNNSGIAIQKVLSYYNEHPHNLIVLHDEIELPFGQVRLKFNGGHKGHNGVRSIQTLIGSSDFFRIRIGVGRPDDGLVADYVLSDFSEEEKSKLPLLIDAAHVLLRDWVIADSPIRS